MDDQFQPEIKSGSFPTLNRTPQNQTQGHLEPAIFKRFKMIWVHTGMKAMDASTPPKPKAASLGLSQVGDQQSQ
jgi:hypothetical protein